ncbi:hypothetical protein PLESTF_001233100 [Pleodorina starrii]|nr:hypothetical protein PLESTM_000376200 [Pleodorina starrii]GLC72303.1 hypothetical protein PLESTF_001233100 [Pleodorina starrii]
MSFTGRVNIFGTKRNRNKIKEAGVKRKAADAGGNRAARAPRAAQRQAEANTVADDYVDDNPPNFDRAPDDQQPAGHAEAAATAAQAAAVPGPAVAVAAPDGVAAGAPGPSGVQAAAARAGTGGTGLEAAAAAAHTAAVPGLEVLD